MITNTNEPCTSIFCAGSTQFAKPPFAHKTMADLCEAVLNPLDVPKQQGDWVLMSGHQCRTFKEQEAHGRYNGIALDIDDNPPAFTALLDFIEETTGCANAVAYLTKSATKERPKARAIVQLANALGYADWVLASSAFNDIAAEADIISDRATERAAQLIFLPNRGELYDGYFWRDGSGFDPMTAWAGRIAKKKAAIVAAEQELAERQKAVEARRSEFTASGNTSAIEAFNANHSVVDVLLKAGYQQRGSHFRHPHSESGSYSASVKNGRVFALSPADPLHGERAHDAFSALAVLFFSGNTAAATKAVYDEMRRAA